MQPGMMAGRGLNMANNLNKKDYIFCNNIFYYLPSCVHLTGANQCILAMLAYYIVILILQSTRRGRKDIER